MYELMKTIEIFFIFPLFFPSNTSDKFRGGWMAQTDQVPFPIAYAPAKHFEVVKLNITFEAL